MPFSAARALLLGSITLIFVASCSQNRYSVISSDYDRGVNFEKYKTYAWLPDKDNLTDLESNAIVRNNIKNYFSHELNDNYAFRPDTATPDVLLEIIVTVMNKEKVEEHAVFSQSPAIQYNTYLYTGNPYSRSLYSSGPFYTPYPNPYIYSGYNSAPIYSGVTQYLKERHEFKESTLTLNMIDTKSNRLVWATSVQADIYDGTTYDWSKEIHPAVHGMLKRSPLKLALKK
jgi:hypothetical protein